MNISPGTLVHDKLTDNALFIVKNTETPINEKTAKYDYNKNPISVYELEKEKDYTCHPEEDAIMVIYPDAIEKHFDSTEQIKIDKITTLIEKKKIKPYYFPASRLTE